MTLKVFASLQDPKMILKLLFNFLLLINPKQNFKEKIFIFVLLGYLNSQKMN